MAEMAEFEGGMAMTIGGERSARRANRRLAIALAVVAVMFYVGILMLKHS